MSKHDSSRKQRVETNHKDIRFPVGESLANLPAAYPQFFSEVVAIVKKQRQVAIQKVNVEQNLLYWQLGKHIAAKQAQQGWGRKSLTACLKTSSNTTQC